MATPDECREGRVLVLAPTARDAALSRGVLADADVPCEVCPDLDAVCREMEAGAGAAVVTEEALGGDGETCLSEALGRQPPWSDFPLIVLTGGGADSLAAARALETLGNVTLLERPVRVATLVSAVRAALRARRRQYLLREHLAERERIAEALRSADRRKDEFMALLGHELRNPLAPMRTSLHVLRLHCGDDPVLAQLGAMLERQVGHMVRLVDDLLDVSRITRGKVDLRVETVELADLVSRSVDSVRPFLDERRHRLEVVLPATPVRLNADPARIEQVISNLLSNAGKYTEVGGHVRLTAEARGDHVEVRVRDNGIGIRPEMVSQIFEMFTQADRVGGRLREGLGLGLTLVRSLVEMHGGTVSVSSDGPGRGSEFVVRLPLAAPSQAARAAGGPAAASERPAGNGVKVLIVDDNEDGAKSLALLLELAGGHDVRVAHDGPAGLAAAGALRPDVVLLDIGLPNGMTGYEVAGRLRGEVGLTDAFLVALTGYGQEEDRRAAAAAGFNAHWVKPVAPTAVIDLLSQVARRVPRTSA